MRFLLCLILSAASMVAGNLTDRFNLTLQRVMKDGPPELFNLAHDIGETKDLAGEKPETVKELQSLYDKWDSQMVEPKWGGRKASRSGAKAQD